MQPFRVLRTYRNGICLICLIKLECSISNFENLFPLKINPIIAGPFSGRGQMNAKKGRRKNG